LLYERRLDSFSALFEEAKSMDEDAGLRMSGRYAGRSCYIFVTRFGRAYTVMVYERPSGKGKTVGRRLAVMEHLEANELQPLLRKLVPGRVVAYSY